MAEKPLPRYIVGDDARGVIEASKKMSDADFQDMMRKQFFGR
ncbi:MAG: hypothetical protein ABI347_00030 [Nitrososphaera sp.]|jgi:hypothetical protein